MTQTPPPPHRAEIDGLRAIAVLAVVLYHFGLPGLPGALSVWMSSLSFPAF